MIITSSHLLNATTSPYSNLRLTLRDKANKIKQKTFKISMNSNQQNVNRKAKLSKSFISMLYDVTDTFKQQMKCERRKLITQPNISQQVNFQDYATITRLRYNNSLLSSNECNKKRTVISQSNLQIIANYTKQKIPFKRKMSCSNNRQKLLKGRPESMCKAKVQRKRYISSADSRQIAQIQTQNFIPVGNVQYSKHHDHQKKQQFSKEKIINKSQSEDQHLKHIYERIFIRYPQNKPSRASKSSQGRRFNSSTQLHYNIKKQNIQSVKKLSVNKQPAFIQIQTKSPNKNNTSRLTPWLDEQF